MGYQDRDYIRNQPPPGIQLRAPRSMVMTIIIINAALFLANMLFFSPDNTPEGPYWTDHAWIADMAGPSFDNDPDANLLSRLMAGSAGSLIYPWRWWQLITAGFTHSPFDFFHIVINMFVLWSFGSSVEPRLGRHEFLRFYLLAILVGSIAFALRQFLMVGPDSQAIGWGASGATTAVVLLFALHNPNATVNLMMVFPVKAWVAAVIMIAINVLGAGGVRTAAGANIAYDVHLAGAAFAYVYFRYGWNFGRMIPSSISEGFSGLRKSLRRKPKLRVHAPETDDNHDRYAQQDAEADRILVKIDREGVDSLTPQERKVMDNYSRRMQQKHR